MLSIKAMASTTLRGLTWDHRRAIDPLLGTLPAFRRGHPDVTVVWDKQPLAGFEYEPVAALARRYDLLVFDHPHVGAIAAAACLRPLDDLVGPGDAFVGPSLASYRWGGNLWGLPIDAATQVAVYRPDLFAALDTGVPRTWPEVIALGGEGRRCGRFLALALQGVHSLMTFYTLCASLGAPCGTEPGAPFVAADVGPRALETLRTLADLCPPEALGWNSIVAQDAMGDRDDLLYCPAIYGFATYAEPDRPKPLRFAALPGGVGSTLGGAGIGISAFARDPATAEAAEAYVRHLAQSATQRAFATHHGQPAHGDAWSDAAIDRRFGGFFSATRATMAGAWVRPRYPGYLAFQKQAGDLIEAHLRQPGDDRHLLADLARLHAARG